MADLIESEIDKCATSRTAPMVAENPAMEHVAEAIPAIPHEDDATPPVEGVDDETAAEERPAVQGDEAAGRDEQDRSAEPAPSPRRVPAVAAPVSVASLDSDTSTARPRPAFVPGVYQPMDRDMTSTGSISRQEKIDLRADGSTSRYEGATTATPSALKRVPQRLRADAVHEKAKPFRVASLETAPPVPSGRPVRGGLMIQIGATPTIEQANALIARAKTEAHGVLAGARPFTEKVQKGGATLYRARFAGLEAPAAEAACKGLKRAGMACFSTRN
jgi:D-alanyl-D-alanine carboxypeptidase